MCSVQKTLGLRMFSIFLIAHSKEGIHYWSLKNQMIFGSIRTFAGEVKQQEDFKCERATAMQNAQW